MTNPHAIADGSSLTVGSTAAFAPRPATIALTNPANATIITGGTGTVGMTVSNSSTSNNTLNYTMTAVVTSGVASLGAVNPASGSLAPSSSRSCTVSATSTNIGVNAISFTAADPNASNSPQTANATLTVLDHAAGRAVATSGNGFVVHVGTTGLTASISLNNLAGMRSDLQVAGATIASGSLSGPASTYWLSAGTSQFYTATFNVGNTPGTFSDKVTFIAGDRQSLSGANLLGMLTTTITGTVFSGAAQWTSTGDSDWSNDGNWTDVNAACTHAAPSTFGSFADSDSAAFNGSGSVTTIDLSGANPSLAALRFSGSDYTLTGGTLTLAGGIGEPTIAVAGRMQTVFSTIAGTQGLWKTGSGTLVLGGTDCYTGGTFVEAGELVVTNADAIVDGTSVTVGSPACFPNLAPVATESVALAVPEPSTLTLFGVGVLSLLGRAKRSRERHAQTSRVASP